MFKGYKERLILLTLIVVFSTLPVYGQVKDWGDVSRKVLAMDVYSPDSSASAVVLFNKGHLRVGDDLQYFLDRHVRIKIIRPEGYKWATIELDYNKEYNQEIEDLEAVTYTSEGDQINENEVDDDAIFEEEIINDWNRLTFTFPSLKPGCIIEYRYTLKVGSPDNIPEWYFDRTIPVEWSELRAEIPSFLKFTKVLKGVEKLDVN